MPRKEPSLETSYYDSDDEPCRIHRDENGCLTGDAYRSGRGIVAIDPTDISYNGFPISQARYDELVRELDESFVASNPPLSK